MILDFLIKPITDLISPVVKSFLPPEKMSEEKAAEIDLAIKTAVAQMDMGKLKASLDEYNATQAESLAEIGSDDKFTKRARPFGVYCASLITAALAIGMMFGIKIDTGAIATLILPLWGNAGWYTYNRSKEKISQQ